MTSRREYQKRILLRRKVRKMRNRVRSHIHKVMRPPFYGIRCVECKCVPPQPGEIMEE